MTPIPVLQRAVEQRHDCFALLREIVHVRAPRSDGSDWEGPVVVFSLAGHPIAQTAYAWSEEPREPGPLQILVALQLGSIDSPRSAVQRMTRADSAAEQAS